MENHIMSLSTITTGAKMVGIAHTTSGHVYNI